MSPGEHPQDRPVTPQEVLATIYRHLGINTHQDFLDFSGRPIPLLQGAEAIAELV